MTNVKDILGGLRSILHIDDLVDVQSGVKQRGSAYAELFLSPTAKGGAAVPVQSRLACNTEGPEKDNFAAAAGWLFNAPAEQLVSC